MNTAGDNKMSIKEVKIMFMRKVAEDLGFDCPHDDIGYPKDQAGTNQNRPYCKLCWKRLNQTSEMGLLRGKIIRSTTYEPVKNFLDEFYERKDLRQEKGIETRISKFEHEK